MNSATFIGERHVNLFLTQQRPSMDGMASSESPQPSLLPFVAAQPLVDHHCHGVLRAGGDLAGLLNEAEGAAVTDGMPFDSLAGLALRRWCPPLLGLEPHASMEAYQERRAALDGEDVNQRFLRAAGLDALCVDTGYAARVVGFKSIAAYRVGLALEGRRPSDGEVVVAAARWLGRAHSAAGKRNAAGKPTSDGTPARLADEVLHRFFIWCAADLGLPIQFHVGYGDRDINLHQCNPLLLTDLLRALEPTGAPVMLLHNYPYHREAGYLAQVFPHVYADLGLATHNVGARATALLHEALELVPLRKFLFSSDAFGLPELYYLGTLLFRRALSSFLSARLADDDLSYADAERITRLIGAENARRAYRLVP
jgi:hypothetical protein